MERPIDVFNYYCLDRIKPITEELYITYSDDGLLRKTYYKIGLIAFVKKIDCFVLYTATDEDLNAFIFIPVEFFYDNYQHFMTDIISKDEFKNSIRMVHTINIFEFASLLDFTYIYNEFKELLEYNWEALNMNQLIEA